MDYISPYERYRERENYDLSSDLVSTYGSGSTTPYQTSYDFESISDVVTPGYKKIIAEGGIVNNPCTYARSNVKTEGSAHHHYFQSGGYDLYGPVTYFRRLGLGGRFWTEDFSAAPLSSTEERAKLLALAHVDATPYQFGEDILEIRETLRFLRNPLSSILDIRRHMMRKARKRAHMKNGKRSRSVVDSKREALRYSKSLGDLYLQYRFALSPLVRSCYNAYEAYVDDSNVPPENERLSARGVDKHTSEYADQHTFDANLVFDRKMTRTRAFKASILYEVSNPIYDWKYKLGLRFKDIPTTLWQVFPYSFMVDRVYDISHATQGLVNLLDPRVKILTASVSHKEEEIRTYSCVGDVYVSPQPTIIPDTRVETDFSYTRVPWDPSFSDIVPQSNLANLVNEATKVADLVTLIQQRFTR